MDGRLTIKTDLDTKSVDAQIKYLEHELNNIKAILSDKTIEYDIRLKYESDAEKLQNRIDSLKASMNDLPDDKGKKIGDNFEKGMKSLKRFALSLFSIRSAYALVSKASSAYLSQDIDLAQKLQNVWVGLGSFLAPAIEYISDMLLKGLGYLNEFIKALTGIDFIAKANAKALDKQAQAQKNLNKQTYGFDEMTIAQDNSSTSSSSSSGLIEMPKLDNNLVKKLQNLALWLRENWDLIKNVGIALGVTFGTVKIAGLLSNIGSLIGSNTLGTGLLGLKGILTGLAVTWAIAVTIDGVSKVVSGYNEMRNALNKATEKEKERTSGIKEMINSFWDLDETQRNSKKQLEDYSKELEDNTYRIINNYKALEESKNWIYEILGVNKKNTEQQKELKEQLRLVTSEYGKLYSQGLLNDEQMKKFANTLSAQIEIQNSLGEDTTELRMKYEKLTGQKYTLQVNAYLKDNVTSEWNKIIGKLSSGVGLGGGFTVNPFGFSGGGGGSTGHFAHGGIVYQPTRALIGEAGYPEAVVPMTADYLSTLANLIAQYGGNGNGSSGVTNIYLDGRLIQRQIVQRTEEIDFARNN